MVWPAVVDVYVTVLPVALASNVMDADVPPRFMIELFACVKPPLPAKAVAIVSPAVELFVSTVGLLTVKFGIARAVLPPMVCVGVVSKV